MMRPAVGLPTSIPPGPTLSNGGRGGRVGRQPQLTAVEAHAMKIAPSFPEGPAMGDRQAIGIGLLGLGNVGAEVYRLLQDGDALARAAGRPMVVKRVAVARPDRPRRVSVPASALGSNGLEILTSPQIDIGLGPIGRARTTPPFPLTARSVAGTSRAADPTHPARA